jgi:hypothetical protein
LLGRTLYRLIPERADSPITAAVTASTPTASSAARGSIGRPIRELFARCDITDPNDAEENAEPNDAAEPTENAEHTDPIDPIDKVDPTDPIERNEPFDAIDRNESPEVNDSLEPPIRAWISEQSGLL